jgi:hypothetical protein
MIQWLVIPLRSRVIGNNPAKQRMPANSTTPF